MPETLCLWANFLYDDALKKKMRFWHCQSPVVGVLTQKVTLSERHCISWGYVCRIAQQWFEGKEEDIFYVSEWPLGFPLPTHTFKNGDRKKALPICLQNRRVFLSPMSHDQSEWPQDFGILPMLNENVKKPHVFGRSVLKHRRLCVCEGWGLESGCRFLLSACFFVFVFSVRIAQSRCPTKKDLM